MLIYFIFCKLTAVWRFHITPSGMRNVNFGKHTGPVFYLWLSRVKSSGSNENFIKITQFPFQGKAAIGVCLLSTGICNYCGQYCRIDVLLEVRHLLVVCMGAQINTQPSGLAHSSLTPANDDRQAFTGASNEYGWVDAHFPMCDARLYLRAKTGSSSVAASSPMQALEIVVHIGPSIRSSVCLWTESCPLCIFHKTSQIHFIFTHLINQLQEVWHILIFFVGKFQN